MAELNQAESCCQLRDVTALKKPEQTKRKPVGRSGCNGCSATTTSFSGGKKREKKRMAKRRNSIHLLSCAPGEPPQVPLYGHRGAHRQLPHGPPTPFLFHPPTLPLNKSFPFQRNGSIVTLTHAQEIKRRYRSNLCAPLAAVRCRMCLPAHTHGKHSHTFAPG